MEEKVVDEKREPVKPMFVWIPIIISFLMLAFLIIMKVSERVPDGFTTWAWVVGFTVITLLSTGVVSAVIYRLTSLKVKKKADRELNGRDFCDNYIRDEIRRRFGYNLKDITSTGESGEGMGYYGKNGQDLIYHNLYRIMSQGKMRYLLVVQNAEKSKEDILVMRQSTLNFPDFDKVVREMSNSLTTSPEKYAENEQEDIDTLSGRRIIRRTRSPIIESKKSDEEEES